QLLGVDLDALPFGEFIPRDDLVVRDLAVDRAGLLVANAALAGHVDLIEPDLAAGRVGGVASHGDRDEAEPNEGLPAWASCHGRTSPVPLLAPRWESTPCGRTRL